MAAKLLRSLVLRPKALGKNISTVLKTARLPGTKAVGTQIREIVKLRFGPTRLRAKDYHWYNMANKVVYDGVDLDTFGGTYLTGKLHRHLNSALWDAVVTDKLIMAMVFSRTDVPQPQLYAAACHFVRNCGGCKVFSSAQALSAFLADGIPYPFFCKPIKGGSGIGCYRVEAYDNEKKKLRLADGNYISITDFLNLLEDPSGWGFLFQEAVLPHPDTANICGSAVTGCRIIILLDDDDARPFRVTWKIPAGDNHIDNFVGGSSGNLMANVDIETGRVTRVVSGFGAGLGINPRHPDTNASIVGEKVPDWEKMMDMIKSASRSFPGFRFQHWDVGITSKGPVVYELNTAGDLYVSELAKGSGVYDAELKAFIDRYGEEGRRSKYVGTPPVS